MTLLTLMPNSLARDSKEAKVTASRKEDEKKSSIKAEKREAKSSTSPDVS